MMRRARLSALFLALAAVAAPAAAVPLVADLSSDRIGITANFAGTELLLFGAVAAPGDVIVVVRGPVNEMVIHRRERIGGIWIKRNPIAFEKVPGFYAVAASRSLGEIESAAFLAGHGIGVDKLELRARSAAAPAVIAEYRAALIRGMRRQSLYSRQTGTVTLRRGQLFRTTVRFPSSVPVGTFEVAVFLVRDGRLVSVERRPLEVDKAGIEAAIFDFAHQQSAAYGAAAILIALFAGWLAGAIFKKV